MEILLEKLGDGAVYCEGKDGGAGFEGELEALSSVLATLSMKCPLYIHVEILSGEGQPEGDLEIMGRQTRV